MRRMLVRSLLTCCVVVAIASFPSCGGSGLPHSGTVVPSISPSSATVAVNGTLTLTGNAIGFSASPIVQWWVQESHDLDASNDCGYLSSQQPPQSGCPYGYVMFASVTTFPSSATYHAPSAPGVYHVTFSATQAAEFSSLTKTVQSTITVQ